MGNLFTWKLHGDGKTLAPGEVVEPDERLTWTRTIGIGAQHVIARFIAPIAAVASAGKGIPAASFGIMVTGLLLALVGVAVHFAGAKWIDIIMPPVVNGAIVAIIGFNLAPSVWSNWQKGWDTALVTLLAVLLIAVLFRGLVGRLNILLGVIVGYVYACFRGQVDFSAIGDAAWIGFPKFHLPQVDFSILPMFIPVVLVLVAENVGHVKSVAQMTGRDYDGHMGTALIGIRIWVENKVNFDKPLNIMVAAIVMIIGIADFTFAFQGVQFNGIAIGTVVILVAYHGLKAIGKATGTIDKDDPDIL